MLLMLPVATLLALPPQQPAISLEYAVKATYLYKLAPFVNWPPGTFHSADAPFDICVVGPDPFDDFLEKAVSGHTLGTHPFRIRRMETIGAGDDCQIVFIGYAKPEKVREALQALQGRPALHVMLIGVFLTLTTPITLMLLVRAALYRHRVEDQRQTPPR